MLVLPLTLPRWPLGAPEPPIIHKNIGVMEKYFGTLCDMGDDAGLRLGG
jgi:hypothetical protein